jgi:hypothetical protein
VLAAGRRALAALLHGALLATQRTRTATPLRCPGCQHAAVLWDWRERSLLTLCGPLRCMAASPQAAAWAAARCRERGYFSSNQARMQYSRFQAAGLPIGSGAVESSAKHVVHQRLKLPGARWSEPGARALLALLALSAQRATTISLTASANAP